MFQDHMTRKYQILDLHFFLIFGIERNKIYAHLKGTENQLKQEQACGSLM